MKRVAVVLLSIGGLIAPTGLALASTPSRSFVGKYHATIKSDAFSGELKGKWTFTFTETMWIAARNGKRQGEDKYSVNRHKVTFKPGGDCTGSGTYRYTLDSTKLRFTRISDSCSARRTLLASLFVRAR